MIHTLAIDLGKFKSVCCWYDIATKATAFRTVATNQANLREAILHEPNVTVVVEACSPVGWVGDLCAVTAEAPEGVSAGPRKAVWCRFDIEARYRKRTIPVRHKHNRGIEEGLNTTNAFIVRRCQGPNRCFDSSRRGHKTVRRLDNAHYR